ncbi:MAG: SDR family NAD(P)-dependent oxidoreductase [Leptolyngbyaceae cyanobacterium]
MRSGGVDILINNAAIDPKVNSDGSITEMSRFEHFPLDQWDFQLDVGLKGVFLCSQVFVTAMAKRGSGVIVNIASDLSITAPDQRLYRRTDRPEEQQPVKIEQYNPPCYKIASASLSDDNLL